MNRIERVTQNETLYACIRFTMTGYSQIQKRLKLLDERIPSDIVTGSPILIRHYVSSVREGTLVELGYPVSRKYQNEEILTRTIRRVECLSLKAACSLQDLSHSYDALFDYAAETGIISDEYGIEIIHDIQDLNHCRIEARLVIHPWENLFRDNLKNSLGEEEADRIFSSWETLSTGGDLDQRFQGIKEAVKTLEEEADDYTCYDSLSRCAHVFPREQIEKLRAVFQKSVDSGESLLEAVDQVIAFMDSDPGWAEGARREGNVVYTSKGPVDPAAFEKAVTPEEKAAAACFCPIVRKKLDQGMPATFCYCGSGWYRQQWEGATGLPVRVEILSSLLNGDAECSFAVHLPIETDEKTG